ncbi:MAG: enolase C-terminal domain-like protein [Caldilineaceae bacterium]
MSNPHIIQIEYGTLVGQRPREAGCNARLAVHGLNVNVPLARITTDDGATGFGPCRTTMGDASELLGVPLQDLLKPAKGVVDHATAFEFPLWDLVGHRTGKAVYQLLAEAAGNKVITPFRVPCYDTSLYIDDLHLDDNAAAAALIAEEARFGYEHNHRSFKIKVGRGARHMAVAKGTDRDIAVIHAVRDAVGPEAHIMIDANNGYTLNLAKQVLSETADCNLFWLEEAFHEDRVLYADLREWLDKEGLAVLIADGEGQASPTLLDWAKEGVVDVIQYDIFSYGLTHWLRTGAQLDGWNVRSAPHHYGRHVGNYIAGHLAAAIKNFTFVEWDEVTTPGLDASAYRVEDGHVLVPNAPGFGLRLEEARFQAAVAQTGFALKL